MFSTVCIIATAALNLGAFVSPVLAAIGALVLLTMTGPALVRNLMGDE
jgi:hypothetical protein